LACSSWRRWPSCSLPDRPSSNIVARSLEQGRRGRLVSKYVGAAYLVYLGVRRMLDRRSVVPVAGTAAQWLRARPRFLASERWISGSMYVGLGVLATVSTSRRT